jgi:hypothetical protein
MNLKFTNNEDPRDNIRGTSSPFWTVKREMRNVLTMVVSHHRFMSCGLSI